MATVPLPHQFAVGEVVTADNINTLYSGISFLENRPLFKATTTVNVSIPNSAFTVVTWNNNVVDTYNGHSVTTNTSRYTAQVAGWYWATADTQWANNATGIRDALFSVNGTTLGETFVGGWTGWNNSGLSGGLAAAPGPIFLNVNDFLEVQVFQNSGGALNLVVGMFAAIWIHV